MGDQENQLGLHKIQRVRSAGPRGSTGGGVDHLGGSITSITETTTSVRAARIERSSHKENHGGGE